MALRDEFERAGNRLFRWRSYAPLLLIPVALLSVGDAAYPRHDRHLQDGWEVLCLAVALVGLSVRCLVVGFTPRGTSGRHTRHGQRAATLNTTGLYSVVRHPLYLGNFFIALGMGLMPRSFWLALVIALSCCLYYERIAFAEEEFLRQRFGQAFEDWAARTPAFVPRLANWRKPELSFSPRNILKREYSALFTIAALFALFDGAVGSVAEHRPTLHALARWVFLVGLAIYLTLRTLKKKTRVLHLAGR